MTEQYIGDGVPKNNRICLEPEVLNQLIVFSKQCYMESNKS